MNQLIQIYEKLGSKINNLDDFVEFMHEWPRDDYFDPYQDVIDILFEIYFIRLNGDTNNANFNILSVVNNYNSWKNGLLRFHVDKIENADGASNFVQRIWSILTRNKKDDYKYPEKPEKEAPQKPKKDSPKKTKDEWSINENDMDLPYFHYGDQLTEI